MLNGPIWSCIIVCWLTPSFVSKAFCGFILGREEDIQMRKGCWELTLETGNWRRGWRGNVTLGRAAGERWGSKLARGLADLPSSRRSLALFWHLDAGGLGGVRRQHLGKDTPNIRKGRHHQQGNSKVLWSYLDARKCMRVDSVARVGEKEHTWWTRMIIVVHRTGCASWCKPSFWRQQEILGKYLISNLVNGDSSYNLGSKTLIWPHLYLVKSLAIIKCTHFKDTRMRTMPYLYDVTQENASSYGCV